MNDRSRRTLKRVALVIVGLFLVIQVFRPTRDNPPEDPARTLEAVLSPPPAVRSILDRACADCHSNRTRWPWYTNVAPMSWFVAHHVHDGRRAMSFSTWADLPVDRQARRLLAICREARSGDMPLSSYLIIHRDAKLSSADLKTLCDWTASEHDRLAPATPATSATPASPATAPAPPPR
ncbi:MAG TPA: heme-binding domain-containing protein [Kofleriaceae bacterium]|nr:heme-binding domain-containing protein [Kofleriaceae bacterium]